MTALSLIGFITASCAVGVTGHGYLLTPRSKQAYSTEMGRGPWEGDKELWPAADYETASSLVGGQTYGVCGRKEGNDYIDYTYDWLTAAGTPMPWTQVAEHVEGDTITIETVVRANHRGYFEIGLCAMDDSGMAIPSQDCFDANKLVLLEDVLYGGPVDEDYPTRAYLPPDHFDPLPGYSGPVTGGQEIRDKDGLLTRHTFQLPPGVHGEKVYLQWHWITFYGCVMPGWDTYPWPDGWAGDTLPSRYCKECSLPLPDIGNDPQQYWNCAQIKIAKADTKSPSPTLAPVTPAPVDSLYCCAPMGNIQLDCIAQPRFGDWCDSSEENCGHCGGAWVDVYNPPTCSSWWTKNCEQGAKDNCCDGSKCRVNAWGKLACLPN